METNPFSTHDALRESKYFGLANGRVVRMDDLEATPELFTSAAIGAFQGFVADPQFPCVGAKSAMTRESIRFGVYDKLGAAASSAGLAHDLFTFTQDPLVLAEDDFVTFVAIFREPGELTEVEFEQLLWDQLAQLTKVDAPLHDWDPTVSRKPDDPHFAFSFAGLAFFVVGLHPQSSRLARQFPWPTLVFNPHAQFVRLKESQKMARMQEVIRERENDLQGSLNPNLGEHGEISEARQYSGRPVEHDWEPPVDL
ncbi:guanitoxin biosynthesis heme-dependent pre-guanitoxin N-hydroxylase GntA [Lacipirellula sp.]|uniref:guanitoxin biosynthesis heme-dependent pre-guanitoxin N-hydroxylase GntA n=1 Tax=Lacipirellula sp. TaxID=2691419 RepID=UPI003D0AD7AB